VGNKRDLDWRVVSREEIVKDLRMKKPGTEYFEISVAEDGDGVMSTFFKVLGDFALR
jgi:hypothetical protein